MRALWVTTIVCLLAVWGWHSEARARDDHDVQLKAATDARVGTPLVRRAHALSDGKPLVALVPSPHFDPVAARAWVLVGGDHPPSRHVSSCVGPGSSRGPPA